MATALAPDPAAARAGASGDAPSPEREAEWAAAALRAAAAERACFREVFAARARDTVLGWADTKRFLSPEANALAADAGGPVKYSSTLTPYQRAPMEALSDPRTEFVVCMFPSQDGKTEILNNFIGRQIDQNPGPMLVLQPTKELAEAWSKDRLAPMLRDSPALHGKVRDARSKDSHNTILHKTFAGGHLTIVGSNSAAGLSARPIRDVAVDEVDRCATSAGTEGDSIRLAFRRATTFRRGKKLMISSPTVRGHSRIWAEYELGTQEEWHVPCPHCGAYQWVERAGKDDLHGIHWEPGRPETAYLVCRETGCVIEEHHKGWMNAHGDYFPQNALAGPQRRSFRKNAWLSNLVSWEKLVREWLDIQGKPEQLQQYINTVDCRLWDPVEGERLNAHVLEERQRAFQPRLDGTDEADRTWVPPEAGVIVRTTDTQGDRLETAVWAFGEHEEAWLVDFDLVPGDPSIPFGNPYSPWNELDQIIRTRVYRHGGRAPMRPAVTFIDSGGHAAGQVYAFTRERNALGVFAIKGLSEQEGAPLLGNATRNNHAKAILYPVGSFTGKEIVWKRLARITEPGPGYIHLPDWLSGEQLSQFTNEELKMREVGGRPRRRWIQVGRTEQFHLAVYAFAALEKLGPVVKRNLGALAEQLRQAPADATLPTGRAARGRRVRHAGVTV